MKLLFKVFISYTLILGPLVPYQSFARDQLQFSQVDMFDSPPNKNAMYLDGPQGVRVVNEYRLLGFSNFPDITHDGFKQALRTPNVVLSQSPAELLNSSDYKRLLNTESGRSLLFRNYQGAFSSLSVVTGENLTVRDERLRAEIRSQVLQENLYSNEPDENIREKKIKLEVNRRVLGTFPEHQLSEARVRVTQAQTILKDPIQRATLNFRTGIQAGGIPNWRANLSLKNQILNFKGERLIRVKDPFGKTVNIAIPKTAQGQEKVSGSQMMRDLAKGTLQTGLMGMAMLVFFYGSAQLAMIKDYENNPRRFEDTLDQTMSWAMPASIASFFVIGDATTKMTDGLNIARKSMSNLNALAQNSAMFANNPELKSEFIKANMASQKASTFLNRATSYRGMTAGFLGSQIIFGLVDRYVDKLESCRLYLASQSVALNGKYTEPERNVLAQTCNKTWADISQEVMTNPQTWMQLTALLSAKTLLTFAMNRSQFIKYAFASDPKANTALKNLAGKGFKYKIQIVSRGLFASPFVGAVAGFVVFSLVFWAALEGLEWGYGRLTLNQPATNAAANIRELFKRYQAEGWDLEKLCDDRNLLNGGILDYLKPLLFWQDTNKCGEDLALAFLENHSAVNAAWRGSLSKPIFDSIQKWTEYTFKVVNLQRATYLFYKDVAEQIKAVRNRPLKLKINRVLNKSTQFKESLGYANTHLYNHPLPLFRSEPFLGWSYRLQSSSSKLIDYPVYNGQTTTWSERMNSKYGSHELTLRKDQFKTEVLPKVIQTLEERAKSAVMASKEKATEKKAIAEILKHLKYLSPYGRTSLPEIAKGLYLISLQTEMEKAYSSCADSIENCFWLKFQNDFLDTEIWQKKDKGPAEFLSGQKFYAGYKTNRFEPYGVKSVGPGQEFFLRYGARLSANGVDPFYYEEGYDGMTDYLLKQMVCGIKVESNGRLQSWFNTITYKAGFKSPEFKAPRISLKGNFDPCIEGVGNKKWSHSANPETPAFYNYIVDKNDPNKSYGGIVDLLYHEASDEFVQDFDKWWETKVAPQFAEVVDKLYVEHYKTKIIDSKLSDLLNEGNNDNNCAQECSDFTFVHKKGVVAALKQELDTYFTYIFDPMLADTHFPLRLEFSDITDEVEGRKKLISDFKSLRSDLYDILNFASGRTPQLLRPKLAQEFQEVLAQVSAESGVKNPEASQNFEIFKLRALVLLIRKKDFELRTLTQADDQKILDKINLAYKNFINAQTDLTEEEKNKIIERFDEWYQEMKQEYDSLTHRDGKVLLDYKDWDDEEESVTLGMVYKTHDNILSLFGELLEVQEKKLQIFGKQNF